MFDIVRKEIEWGGRKLVFETGRMARQADGAVLVTYGETTVLYFNHYLKSFVARSAAGEHAALQYLSQASFAQGLDVRAPNSDILPQSLSPVLPPQRQRRYKTN